jgi:hypothetical protein
LEISLLFFTLIFLLFSSELIARDELIPGFRVVDKELMIGSRWNHYAQKGNVKTYELNETFSNPRSKKSKKEIKKARVTYYESGRPKNITYVGKDIHKNKVITSINLNKDLKISSTTSCLNNECSVLNKKICAEVEGLLDLETLELLDKCSDLQIKIKDIYKKHKQTLQKSFNESVKRFKSISKDTSKLKLIDENLVSDIKEIYLYFDSCNYYENLKETPSPYPSLPVEPSGVGSSIQ